VACLGAVSYDPAARTSKSLAAALALTAFDTTNARIVFTAPANGKVLVRIKCAATGTTSTPQVLLGVLDGSTVRGRAAPMGSRVVGQSAGTLVPMEALFLVSGLTPSTSYTFDAAYGVETGVASSNFRYGGPDDATLDNAAGALTFEVWETTNLLAGTLYDPAAAVTKSLAVLAMTALDTTNLRLAFTVPASGRVVVRIRGNVHGNTQTPGILFGVLESGVVKGRAAATPGRQFSGTATATDFEIHEAEFVVSGLTPSASLTWDAAYGIERVGSGGGLKYGGPNNAVADDAFGGVAFEVWEA
jgi:hypothetical protein